MLNAFDPDVSEKRSYIAVEIGLAKFDQLAEEAAELAQAACKLARKYRNVNPTPVTLDEAWKKVVEEYTDVYLVASIIGLIPDEDIYNQKLDRWCGRIMEAKRGENSCQSQSPQETCDLGGCAESPEGDGQ